MPRHPPPTSSSARRRCNRARGRALQHPRSRAVPVIPGARVKISRRSLEGRMFLLPSPELRDTLHNLVGYTLGVCLQEYGLELHAFLAHVNHLHGDYTDPEGLYPAFKTTFHAWLGRAVNALRGRFGSFWSGDAPVDTHPGDPFPDGEAPMSSPLGDLIYTLTNPVKDGLVKRGDRWPGFTTYGWRFGETRTFKRPDFFFDPDNPDLPDEVSVTLTRPKNIFPELDDDAVYDLLMVQVHEREREIRADMKANNRRFMGETKLAKQDWNKAPRARKKRFVLKRRMSNPDPKVREAAVRKRQAWSAEYAAAHEKFCDGQRDVVFPYGTYWMRHFMHVRIANAPP